MSDVRIVLITAPDREVAAGLGRALVEERLAACANLVPQITSIYRWEGAVQEDSEVLMVVKTSAGRVAALTERVLALHPYEVPEVLVLPVESGAATYLDWVRASVE